MRSEMEKASESLCIVIAAYNEQDVLNEFYQRLSQSVAGLRYDMKFIFVDDGSSDGTLDILKNLHAVDERVVVIALSRNFGKEAAMTAGLDHAQEFDAVIVIDADLQDPPELIPDLVAKWREGNDVVYAQRIKREGESFIKRVTAAAFYRLVRRLRGGNIPANTGDFRLLSQRAVAALADLREQNRFMKGLFTWIGYKQTGIQYVREKRAAGDTKWNYWRLWNFALDGITSFTTLPLKLATYVGAITATLALFYGLVMVVRTLIFGNEVPGYPSIMVVILTLGGVQLVAIGVVGEYVGRMFNEVKRRPLYFIQEHLSASTQPDQKGKAD